MRHNMEASFQKPFPPNGEESDTSGLQLSFHLQPTCVAGHRLAACCLQGRKHSANHKLKTSSSCGALCCRSTNQRRISECEFCPPTRLLPEKMLPAPLFMVLKRSICPKDHAMQVLRLPSTPAAHLRVMLGCPAGVLQGRHPHTPSACGASGSPSRHVARPCLAKTHCLRAGAQLGLAALLQLQHWTPAWASLRSPAGCFAHTQNSISRQAASVTQRSSHGTSKAAMAEYKICWV